MQKIRPYENQIFEKGFSLIEQWRNTGNPDKKQMYGFYSWVDTYVRAMFKKEFSIDI